MTSPTQASGAGSSGTSAPDTLRRGITGPLLFAFVLGDVLGAGIYALMGVLAGRAGGMLWAPLLVALLLALLTAGSYAELVTKYPRAGGAAVFAERAFRNRLVSFLVGFSMLAAGVTSAAGLSIAFAGEYLGTFVDLPATAGLVYVLVGLASAIALPADELEASSGPLLDVVAATGVGIPSWLFSLIALIAVANGALLTMIMASRLAYGMSEQALLPRSLSRVLPRRRTPWVAILATTLVAMLLTLIGDLATLAETVVLLLLFVFISANVSVLVLRRDPVDHPHFRVWTFVPVLGIASCVLLLTQQRPVVWLFAAILLAVGVVLSLVARWARSRTDAQRV